MRRIQRQGKLLKRVEYGFLDGVNLLICKI